MSVDPADNGPASAVSRVLVCFNDQPDMPAVIRAAARIAVERRAEFYALHIEAPGASTRRLPAVSERLAQHQQFARDLGAEVVIARSHRVAEAILQFARDHAITTIVLGQPANNRRWLFSRDVAKQIREGSGPIEVHTVG